MAQIEAYKYFASLKKKKKKKRVQPETRKTDPIIDPFVQFGSDFRQSNPINIGSGFGSQ